MIVIIPYQQIPILVVPAPSRAWTIRVFCCSPFSFIQQTQVASSTAIHSYTQAVFVSLCLAIKRSNRPSIFIERVKSYASARAVLTNIAI